MPGCLDQVVEASNGFRHSSGFQSTVWINPQFLLRDMFQHCFDGGLDFCGIGDTGRMDVVNARAGYV